MNLIASAPAGGLPMGAALQITDRPTVYAVVAGYLLMLVCVGLVFRRFSRNASDYFRAGGQGTWWLVGGSVFMGQFSAWTFTGAAGAAYQVGWSQVVAYGAGSLGYFLLALGPAAWFRRTRMITTADVIRLRFGSGMEQFFAWLQSLMAPLFGGLHLYALAIFVTSLLGFDVRGVILVLGLVVLFYTAMSGAWAALAADFIKGLVLLPIALLMAVVCLRHFGGIGGFFHGIAAAGLQTTYAPFKSAATLAAIPNVTVGYFTGAFLIAYYCTQVANINTLTNAGRFLAVKDDREARRASLLAACALLVGTLVFFIPPMTARLLIPADVAAMPLRAPTEGAYAAMAMRLLPAGLVGMVLVAICASTMSTLDLSLTGLSGLITQNIYPALCRLAGAKPWEGRARLVLGRVVNLCCALTIITIALIMAALGTGGVFNLMMKIIAQVMAPISVPMMWGMFVRRVPNWATPLSIVVGFVVSSGIEYGPRLLGTAPWLYHQQIFALFAASSLAFLGACFIYRRGAPDPAVEAREAEFYSRWRQPVDFTAEIGAGNDGRQRRIVGLFGLAMAGAILLLLIPASSAGHSGKILVIAGCTAAVGALLFSSGRASRTVPDL
jgi:Na+/proline symporter